MAKSFGRQPQQGVLGKKIIIACEGQKTEPNYFRALEEILDIRPNRLYSIAGRGSNPLLVVEKAIVEREKLSRRSPWNGHRDQAWAVIDGDEHIENDPARWLQCLSLAEKENVKLAVCNPCFEYWLLLHYEEYQAHISVGEVIDALKKHIPNYGKSQSYLNSPLLVNTQIAIRNANRVHAQAQLHELHKYRNPCAHVAALVEAILELAVVWPPQPSPRIREEVSEYVVELQLIAGTY